MTGGNPVLEAIRRLAGHQAVSLDEAFRVFLGYQGDPDLAPVALRRDLCELLRAYGYRERLMQREGDDEAHLMWVRSPWPIDVQALDGRELDTFAAF